MPQSPRPGLFTLRPDRCTLVRSTTTEQETRVMDAFTLINFMDAKCVAVMFPGNVREYTYFVPEGDDPKVGDVVMTSTSWDTFMPEGEEQAKPNYQDMVLDAKLARVVQVLDGGHPKATRFYMQLLSVKQLREAHEANQALAKKASERQAVFKKLDDMLAKRSKLQMYEQLAAENPEARVLLESLKG